MTSVVCDANVLFKLLVPEEDTEAAKAVARDYELVTLDLAFAEVGNALWARVQRGELTIEAGRMLAVQLQAGTVETRPVRSLVPRGLEIAAEIRHPIYDCLYLVLAEALRIPLVTADRRFLTAQRRLQSLDVDVRPLGAFA